MRVEQEVDLCTPVLTRDNPARQRQRHVSALKPEEAEKGGEEMIFNFTASGWRRRRGGTGGGAVPFKQIEPLTGVNQKHHVRD